ncbi:hypothetical protein MFUL124B02_30980 [Myxococcus fulvus 124B02]|nr:hypothetical protein MFUL124B02_30980 [Myxococcus fulvus 124B02]
MKSRFVHFQRRAPSPGRGGSGAVGGVEGCGASGGVGITGARVMCFSTGAAR